MTEKLDRKPKKSRTASTEPVVSPGAEQKPHERNEEPLGNYRGYGDLVEGLGGFGNHYR